MIPNYLEKMLSIRNTQEFNSLVMDAFNYQFENLTIYRSYCNHLNIDPSRIDKPEDVPFLPIEFFKNHRIISDGQNSQLIFTSSGTTGTINSRHYIVSRELYHASLHNCFLNFYGNPTRFCILALLPSYLERKESSLVYMVKRLMKLSGHNDNGFYLYNTEDLANKLKALEYQGQKTILIGVSFALLDLAEKYPMPLKHTIIMETGGMKGRRKEITRQELHSLLGKAFDLTAIHSEYGMTELLSQAYSYGGGFYNTPAWMKIVIRDIYDPFHFVETGKGGGINVIDLANIYSCSFIETKDIGKLNSDGSFEISGRFDNSDTRGCNLLVD